MLTFRISCILSATKNASSSEWWKFLCFSYIVYTRVQLTLCSNQAVPTLKVIPKCVTPVRLCRFWPRVKGESAQLYREELWNNFSHRLQGWTADSYFWSLCWGQPRLSLKTRRSSLIGNRVLLVRIFSVRDQLFKIIVKSSNIYPIRTSYWWGFLLVFKSLGVCGGNRITRGKEMPCVS